MYVFGGVADGNGFFNFSQPALIFLAPGDSIVVDSISLVDVDLSGHYEPYQPPPPEVQ